MKTVAASADAIVSTTVSALSCHMTVGQSLLINSSSAILSMHELMSNEVPNRTIHLADHSLVRFPSMVDLNTSRTVPVSIRVRTPALITTRRKITSGCLDCGISDCIGRARISSHAPIMSASLSVKLADKEGRDLVVYAPAALSSSFHETSTLSFHLWQCRTFRPSLRITRTIASSICTSSTSPSRIPTSLSRCIFNYGLKILV